MSKIKYQTTDGTPIETRRMHEDDRVRATILREEGDQELLSLHLDACLAFYGDRIVKRPKPPVALTATDPFGPMV